MKKFAETFNKISQSVIKHEVLLKFTGGISGAYLTYKYFKQDQLIKERNLEIAEESNNIRKESNQIKLKQISIIEKEQEIKLMNLIKQDLVTNEFTIDSNTLHLNNQEIDLSNLDDVNLSGSDSDEM